MHGLSAKKMAVVERWLLVEVRLYNIGLLYSQITCLYLKFYEYP